MNITDLSDDLLRACLAFIGPGNVRFAGAACHRFHQLYSSMFENKTLWKHAIVSISCAEFCVEDNVLMNGEEGKKEALKGLQEAAARDGNVRVLRYLHENYNCKCIVHYLMFGACGGHLDMLDFAEEAHYDLTEDDYETVFNTAVLFGRVSVMDWVHQRHPQQNDVAVHMAFRNGNILPIQWLYDHDGISTAMLRDVCPLAAIAGGHDHVLQWMLDHDVLLDVSNGGVTSEHLWVAAAQEGQVCVLQWLLDHGFEDSIGVLSTSEDIGYHEDVLAWGNERGVDIRDLSGDAELDE